MREGGGVEEPGSRRFGFLVLDNVGEDSGMLQHDSVRLPRPADLSGRVADFGAMHAVV